MRTSVKLATITLLVTATFSGQSAKAQPPMTYAPPPGNYAPVGWGQLPAQGYNPWPTVSPFENKFSQHLNQGGLWFSDNQSVVGGGQRRYFFSTEYLNTKTKEDHGLIGNSRAQTYWEMVYDDLVAETDQQYADDFQHSNYYGAAFGELAGDIEGHGMRMTTGWWNSDNSGIVFEAMWNSDASAQWNARDASTTFSPFPPTTTGALGEPLSFTGFAARADEQALVRQLFSAPDFLLTDIDPIDPDLLLQRNLLNLRGIPIDNGSFAGVTIPYDLNFGIEYRSQVLGGSINMVMAPVIRSEGVMVRPVLGVRYMNVDEQFHFRGEDSGALYDDTVAGTADPLADLKLQSIPDGVDNDDDGIIDNGGIGEDSGTFDINNLDLVAAGGVDGVSSSIVNSFLLSQMKAHLAGPELGLRYDFGSDKGLKVWGQTKVGLLVNHEQMEMSGDNIGMFTRIEDGTFDGTLGSGTPTETFAPSLDNPNPNAFTDSADSTHVSPMFEQSIFAEVPIFEYLPVLQNSRTFEGARLKLGWSFLFVDHIASNTQSIIWQGNPQAGIFPEISIDRRSWWTSNWSAGLEWRY